MGEEIWRIELIPNGRRSFLMNGVGGDAAAHPNRY